MSDPHSIVGERKIPTFVMDQRQLANSLRARKAHVTTKEKALVEALNLLCADSPAIICSRLKESLTRYEAAVKGVDET